MDRDQEIPEIVGSADLRQVFKEKGRVRGSFFVNNIEFHQFEATSIEGLLAAINARANQTHVDASIDDGYHLVLEARSPAPIIVRTGRPYVDAPAPGGGDAAEQVLQRLNQAADKSQKDSNPNTVLQDLGIDGHDQSDTSQAVPGQPAPGMSAEDRRKARYQRAAASGAIRGVPPEMLQQQTYDGPRRVPQGAGSAGPDEQRRYNPVTPEDRALAGVSPASQQNNPDRQKSPVVNSDHQPTYSDPDPAAQQSRQVGQPAV